MQPRYSSWPAALQMKEGLLRGNKIGWPVTVGNVARGSLIPLGSEGRSGSIAEVTWLPQIPK